MQESRKNKFSPLSKKTFLPPEENTNNNLKNFLTDMAILSAITAGTAYIASNADKIDWLIYNIKTYYNILN
jgi:hypothetical protein